MLDRLTKQLNSPDVEQRKKAIGALAKSKDPAAIKYLEAVSRTDFDAEVRDLAGKAIRYIQRESQPAAPAVFSAPSAPAFAEAAEKAKTISARDVERSKSYLDQALSFHVQKDDARAMESLGRALVFNPELANDTVAANLAADLTGLPSAAAVDSLMDPDQRDALIEKKGGGKRKSKAAQSGGTTVDAGWRDALIDLGIYAVVTGVCVGLIGLVTTPRIRELMIPLFESLETTQTGGRALTPAEIEAFFPVWDTGTAVVQGIISAIVYSIIALLFFGLMHFIATGVLNGEGSFTGLLKKTLPYQTVVTMIGTVAGLGLISLIPADIMQLNPETSSPEALNSFMSSFSSLWCVGALGGVLYYVILAKLVGDAYDFGIGKGCGSVLITAICAAVVGCILSFVLQLAFAPFITNSLPRFGS